MKVAIIAAIVVCTPLFVVGSANAEIHRSREVTRAFQRLHPCPANGSRWRKCPGWIKDHIIPLCLGGPDSVDNMQWQTVADAKAKDRIECKRG